MAKKATKTATSNAFSKASSILVKQRLDSQNQILITHNKRTRKRTYFPEYREDPVAYANEILGTYLWKKQREICNALVKHRRVLVRSSHTTGKSFVCANLALWAFDTHKPLSGVITASTEPQVKEVVFAEMRTLAKEWHTFRGTDNPALQDAENHVIRGLVTADPTSMHGRHQPNNFLMVDEATAVDPSTWEAMESLYTGNAYWLAVFNPTDASSYVHHLETLGTWHLITISAFEHPNIIYAMQNFGDPKVLIPGCITLPILREKIRAESALITKAEAKALDIMILDENGNEEWHRPNPICEARYLGRWPSQSFSSIWSDSIVDHISNLIIPPDYETFPIELGVDVARFGSDKTAIIARCGPTVLMAEEYGGLSITEVANLTMIKAREMSGLNNIDERDIPIKVDLNGIGAGVVDILYDAHYNVLDIDVNRKPLNPDKYNTVRTELWFEAVNTANSNGITLYKLDNNIKQKLRNELLAPHYEINASGQMVVESKEKTKKRTKQASPNLADALNLAFYDGAASGISVTVTNRNKR